MINSFYETRIDSLYETRTQLNAQMTVLEAEITTEEARLRKTVTIEKMKGSTLLTTEDGRKVSVGPKNARTEFKIYEHDGNKRGALISSNNRGSIHSVRLALAAKWDLG